MSNSLKFRGILILLCLLLSFFVIAPTLMRDSLPQWWTDTVNPIQLGLDLQGGMHLVLGVEVDKAVESRIDTIIDQSEAQLREKDIIFKRLERRQGDRLVILVYDEAEGAKVDALMAENYPSLEAETMTGGVEDPERAIALLGKTARLEFKMVDETANIQDAVAGKLPPGTELLYEKNVNRSTGATTEKPLVVFDKTVLTGDLLSDANVRIDTRFNEPYVSIEFNSVGAKRFDQITAANVGKRMAIVLDGNVYSAPVIRERIAGGSAQISGSFTSQEATDLAIILRAGSLPAPVKIMENRTVGPSLGQDSINKGIKSIFVGAILVVLAMIIYYQLSGVVAVIALSLNLVFIAAMLAMFGATLTLPGLAGVVLTVGMAVDANVLIFERIREEIRLGRAPKLALESGYSKAFMTIIDANLTTLLAALVLFQFGTGPVRGFAVTLSIGIIASLFTAIFVSRVIFDIFLKRREVKRLSI